MGYLLSLIILPLVLFFFGACVGVLEGIVQTLYFTKDGENTSAIKGHFSMVLSTTPWLFTIFSLHFVEKYLLLRYSKKILSEILLLILAGGIYYATQLPKSLPIVVIFSVAGLHLITSVLFALLIAVCVDQLKHETGFKRQVFAWGYILNAFYLGVSCGNLMTTAYSMYGDLGNDMSVLAGLAILPCIQLCLKRAPPQNNNKKSGDKKDGKRDKGTTATDRLSITDKVKHIVSTSKCLLIYLSFHRVPQLIAAWDLGPEHLNRLGIHPLIALLGMTVSSYTLLIIYVFITAVFAAPRGYKSFFKVVGLLSPLFVIHYAAFGIWYQPVINAVQPYVEHLMSLHTLFGGMEVILSFVYFLNLNSELPAKLRLMHFGLFAAAERVGSSLIAPTSTLLIKQFGYGAGSVCLVASIIIVIVTLLKLK